MSEVAAAAAPASRQQGRNGPRLKQQLVAVFRVEARNMRHNRVAASLIPGRPMRDVEPDHAAANGYLGLVKAMHERGRACTQGGASGACLNGHVEVVRFLHGCGIDCTSFGADCAAMKGDLEMLEELRAHGLR